MCGLIYIEQNNKKDINLRKEVENAYLEQITRGTEGFGYVSIQKDLSIKIGRATEDKEIFESMEKNTKNAKAVLFHHRIPTSTDNLIEATHPIKITRKDKTYYLIHNGIISNDMELYEKHSQKGLDYSTEMYVKLHTRKGTYIQESSFNDSESIAYDFVLFLEGIITKVRAKGTIAVIALEVDKKTNKALRLHYFRNDGNPLEIVKTKQLRKITSMSKNKRSVSVPTHTLFTKEYATDITTQRYIDIEKYITYKETDYSGYNLSEYRDSSNEYYGKEYLNDFIEDYTKEVSNLSDTELSVRTYDTRTDILGYKDFGIDDDQEQYAYNYAKAEMKILTKEYDRRKLDK